MQNVSTEMWKSSVCQISARRSALSVSGQHKWPPSLTYLKLILKSKSKYHLKSLHFSLKDLRWKLIWVILKLWLLPLCPLEIRDNPWNECKLFLYKIDTNTKLVSQWFCLAGLCVHFKACIFLNECTKEYVVHLYEFLSWEVRCTCMHWMFL